MHGDFIEQHYQATDFSEFVPHPLNIYYILYITWTYIIYYVLYVEYFSEFAPPMGEVPFAVVANVPRFSSAARSIESPCDMLDIYGTYDM